MKFVSPEAVGLGMPMPELLPAARAIARGREKPYFNFFVPHSGSVYEELVTGFEPITKKLQAFTPGSVVTAERIEVIHTRALPGRSWAASPRAEAWHRDGQDVDHVDVIVADVAGTPNARGTLEFEQTDGKYFNLENWAFLGFTDNDLAEAGMHIQETPVGVASLLTLDSIHRAPINRLQRPANRTTVIANFLCKGLDLTALLSAQSATTSQQT